MNDNRKSGKSCPICGRPELPGFSPFCSKRCADVDLSRWLGGVYRIESGEGPETGSGTDGAGEE